MGGQAEGTRIPAGLEHADACWDPHPREKGGKADSISIASTVWIFLFLSFKVSSRFTFLLDSGAPAPLFLSSSLPPPPQDEALYCARLNVLIVR